MIPALIGILVGAVAALVVAAVWGHRIAAVRQSLRYQAAARRTQLRADEIAQVAAARRTDLRLAQRDQVIRSAAKRADLNDWNREFTNAVRQLTDWKR